MKILVTSINRTSIITRVEGCNRKRSLALSNEYTITFVLNSDQSFIESEMIIDFDGDLSFEVAKLIIESKIQSD